MVSSLRQRIKVHISLATFTFACMALLAIPFLMTVTGFIPVTSSHAAKTEPSNQVALIELAGIDPALQLHGSLIAQSDHRVVTALTFTLANAIGAKPINLAKNSLEINYRDQNQRINRLTWTKRFRGSHQNNDMLGPGEQIQLTIPLADLLKSSLGPNTLFVIEITTSQGETLRIQRTTPAQLDSILALD